MTHDQKKTRKNNTNHSSLEITQTENLDVRSVKNGQRDLTRGIDFRKIVEDLQVMVCAYNIKGFIYANPAFEKITGYTLEEMRKKQFWEVTHPEEWTWLKPRGEARLRGEEVPATRGFRMVKKNGEIIWVNVFWLVSEWNDKNTVLIAFVDVTENVRLTEQLQAARDDLELRVKQRTEELNRTNTELKFLNQNLENIIQTISDGVVTINHSGEIKSINSFLDPLSDRAKSGIREKFREMLFSKKKNYIHKMLHKKESFRDKEITVATPDGSLSFLAAGTPILNDQGLVDRGVLMLRPMKDVHQLVHRFSGFQASFRFEDIITQDEIVCALIENAKSAAASMSNILIEGESGTGKELFAQAIHNYGPKNQGPFIAVNCGAIPRELIGSELFGYAEGSFTGAKKGGNPGKFELASRGTLFLDEIGDMPFEQQAALLRVIQEKKITRIGGNQAVPVDVRIICATNKDLYHEMKHGSFRQDLYYRLNVINIKIPPLRERRSDIMLLFNYFLQGQHGTGATYRITGEAQDSLVRYDWPGNVRELYNVVERVAYITQGGDIDTDSLPQEIVTAMPSMETSVPAYPEPGEARPAVDIKDTRARHRQKAADDEIRRIRDLLEIHHGNASRAARALGISRTTLYKKLKLWKSSMEELS